MTRLDSHADFVRDLLVFMEQHRSTPALLDSGVVSVDASLSHDEAGERCFNTLALRLFALQYQGVPAYQRWCNVRGATPQSVTHWHDIPAVPTEAFRHYEFSSLPELDRSTVFLSSGTTGSERSRNFHSRESLALYEAALWPWFERHLLADLLSSHCRDAAFVSLTPPANRAPHSSLAHMFGTVAARYPFQTVQFLGDVDPDGNWISDADRCAAVLRELERADAPVLVAGAAFSFVHLLDHFEILGEKLRLPRGSRVLETGGYKGRSRSIAKERLHALIGEKFGIASPWIVSEYGMCELSSQGYSGVAGQACASAPFRFPPWTRVQVVSPETGQEVEEGQRGLLRIYDLANAYSVLAVQTADLAERRGTGFLLHGRSREVEARGCSLLVEPSSTHAGAGASLAKGKV